MPPGRDEKGVGEVGGKAVAWGGELPVEDEEEDAGEGFPLKDMLLLRVVQGSRKASENLV